MYDISFGCPSHSTIDNHGLLSILKQATLIGRITAITGMVNGAQTVTVISK